MHIHKAKYEKMVTFLFQFVRENLLTNPYGKNPFLLRRFVISGNNGNSKAHILIKDLYML